MAFPVRISALSQGWPFQAKRMAESVVAQSFEGMGRRGRVPGWSDHTFADGDVVNTVLFEQKDDIFNDSGGSDHPPFGKGGHPSPEHNVWLDEHPDLRGQMRKPMNGIHGLAH